MRKHDSATLKRQIAVVALVAGFGRSYFGIVFHLVFLLGFGDYRMGCLPHIRTAHYARKLRVQNHYELKDYYGPVRRFLSNAGLRRSR